MITINSNCLRLSQEQRAFPKTSEFNAEEEEINQPDLEPIYNGK